MGFARGAAGLKWSPSGRAMSVGRMLLLPAVAVALNGARSSLLLLLFRGPGATGGLGAGRGPTASWNLGRGDFAAMGLFGPEAVAEARRPPAEEPAGKTEPGAGGSEVALERGFKARS